ncbi:MAG TPA: hypothetical protein VMR70_00805 [Flavisolibacter sp.]|nr:hypothetical protein [Flavisolibacter sp.]
MKRASTFLALMVYSLVLFAQDESPSCPLRRSYLVVIKAEQLMDSLQKQGADTLLFYHRYADNTSFGYGKIIWRSRGVTKQYTINYNHETNRISAISYLTLQPDNIFSYFFQQRLDTLSSNPRDEELESMSHDGRHLVWVRTKNQSHCFEIRRAIVYHYPAHPRSQFVSRLMRVSELREMENGRKRMGIKPN